MVGFFPIYVSNSKGKRYKNSLSHTPCKDTCEAIQKIQQEDEKIRALGMRLKQTYIESGKKVKETDVSYTVKPV